MVFHQTVQTCAPELATPDAQATVTARYKDAITFEEHEISQSVSFADLLAADQALLRKGAAVFAYATALQDYQQNPIADSLTPAFDELALAEEDLPGDPDLAEIRSVLEALRDR
jgi:Ca-activated chloride channel family protein